MNKYTKIVIVLFALVISVAFAKTSLPASVVGTTQTAQLMTNDNEAELQATAHALPSGFKLPDRTSASDLGSWYTYTRWDSINYYFSGLPQYYGLLFRTYDFGLSSPLTFEEIELWTYLAGDEVDSTICLQIYGATGTLLWESGDFLVDTALGAGGYTVYDMPDTTLDVGDAFYVMVKSRTAGYPYPILESDAVPSALPYRRNMVGGSSMTSLGLYGYSPCLTIRATAATASFDLFEGFDGATFPPTGWTANIIGGTTNWAQKTTGRDGYFQFINTYLMGDNTGTTPTPPPAMAMFDCYNAYTGDEARLYTPAIATSTTDYKRLNTRFYLFKSSSYSSSNDTLFIETSTDGGLNWTTKGFVTRYSGSVGWTQYTIDCGIYPTSSNVNIGFRGKSCYGDPLYIDQVMAWQEDVAQNDVGVIAIDIPAPRPIWVGDTRTITVTLKNFAVATQTSIPVSYDPGDGSGVVTETWTGSLAMGDQTTFTFATAWNCNTQGELFTFTANTELSGDEDLSNDAATVQVAVCPPAGHVPPFSKDFNEAWGPYGDNPPYCGWTIEDYGNEPVPAWNTNDWYHSTFLGRSLARIFYSPTEDQNDWLISPKLNCTAPGEYTLKFWHSFGAYYSTYDTCVVVLSADDGLTWTEIARWSSDGSVYAVIDSGYKSYDVTSLVAGYADVKVAFRYIANFGWYWAIDDFELDFIPSYTLTVNTVGNGIVNIVPEQPTYLEGTVVELTADPNAGWAFMGWTGDVTSMTNPYELTMDGNKTLTATFALGGWYPAANVPAAPDLKVGKFVKDGAAMVTVGGSDAGDAIYMFPGNKSNRFYKYDAGVYTTLETIPYGVKITDPLKINKKKVGKGAALCYDGAGIIYATKGNGTAELWAYDILTNTWTQKAFVPVPKALKGGTSLCYYGGKLYLLAGGQKKTDLNNFYVYDPAGDTALGTPWTPDSSLTLGPNVKVWKDGASLAELGGVIYALKTSDKENFFYGYGVLDPHWGVMPPVPPGESLYGKWKKALIAKDGAAMTSGGGAIYAIKGGGANVFWKFDGVAWSKMESIPRLHKKSVPKTGASLAYADGKVWLIKGNNTQELWNNIPGDATLARTTPSLIATEMSNPTSRSSFNFSASMLSKTLRYAVPVSGKVSIKLYNATGRLVETVHNGYLNAGTYTTNLSNIASGVYFVKYEDRTNRAEIKLIVE